MPWIQLSLHTCKADSEEAEQALLDNGALSVTFKDAEDKPVLEPLPGETPLWDQIIMTGLYEADIDSDALLTHITSTLHNTLSQPVNTIKVEALEDKDWVRAWMDDYRPMQFGKRLWVCPKHIPPPEPQAINLMLDPGLAFGTGTHPTTALCLEWLDSADIENKQVLDFGCGSGVLAVAALLLGANHCIGTDIDPQAITASQDNAAANGVNSKLDLYLPNDMPDAQFDIVLANILAGPLTELAEALAMHCKTGGHIVLSGILESQSEKIIQAYSPWFELEPITVKEDWIRVNGIRK